MYAIYTTRQAIGLQKDTPPPSSLRSMVPLPTSGGEGDRAILMAWGWGFLLYNTRNPQFSRNA